MIISALRKEKGKTTTLMCFTPQVMILTFMLEFLLMIRLLFRYSMQSIPMRLVVLLLLFLSLFQLAEYGVCEGLLGLSSVTWARIGFASITMLPPLGVHLVQLLRKDTSMLPTYISYALGALFIGVFTFFDAFDSVGCSGNYAIFKIAPTLGGAFTLYYYSIMIFGAVQALRGRAVVRSKATKEILLAIVIGYASFVVPATLIHLLSDSVKHGLPSIMCGFALFFAVVLGTYIAHRIPKK